MNKTIRRPPAEYNSHSASKSFSKGLSLLVIGVGCLVLVGWALDISTLKTILPGLASMKSNSALLFVLCGISLWMQVQRRLHGVALALAFIVAFVGLITLAEYLLNGNFGIDQLLFRDTTIGALHPGRMAPATALAFLFIGLDLIFLERQQRNLFHPSLIIASFAISGLAFIGYIYGVSSLYQIGAFSSMALHTALTIILLSIGILFARPEQGVMQTILANTAGGNILRRLLPTAVIAPILLGSIGLWGQRLGLYDSAFGFALMVSSLITTMIIFIWLNARELTNLDIKREQLDASLHASELRLHTSLSDMMEGCQILGFDWRYLYINTTAEKHNQRPNSELLGNVYMDMWPGIETTAVFPFLRRCMERRTPEQMVNEFLFPDGSKGWFELSIQPVPDGIFILSSDVTSRKRAEQALIEREMKLSILLEILPVGISILDAERKVSYINPALKNMLDVSEDGLLNDIYKNRKYLRADGTLMPVDELTSVRVFKEKREIDGVEMGIVKEDNNIVWTNISAVPVDFPDWKVVVVTADITQRKQAEDEILKLNVELEGKVAERTATLAQANALLQTMMDHIPDHIFFKDLQGRYIRNSKSQIEMLGLSDPAQAIGKTDFDFFSHAQRSFDEEQEIIQSGQPLIGIEESVTWPDGRETWLSTTKVPLRDQNGQIIGTFGVGRDITDRKDTEVALQKANEQLQQLALFDALTGLYNRRGFLLHAEQQLLLARRAKYSLLIFYGDMDGLKRINDNSSHEAGDKALVEVAGALRNTFRGSDIIARLGGDEFIVLAMEAMENNTQMLMDRLRENLTANNLSMSMGVVVIEPQSEESIDDAIARADQIMYAEKRSKPNRRQE